MDDSVHDTAAVARPAAAGRRIPAVLIDLGVRLLVGGAAGYAVFGPLGPEPERALGAAAVFVAVLVGYPVAMLTLNSGRTLGQAALCLRVVRRDGGPLRVRHALLRTLGGLLLGVDRLIVWIDWFDWVSGPGFGWLEDASGLGDRWAGTVLVDQRASRPPAPVATAAAG